MNQVQFKSVKFRNFQSYGNEFTTVNFREKGTVLIIGEDLDNTSNGISSNGTGKSTILNVLTYGIYDKPISKVTQDGLINNINNKQLEVEVEYIGNDGETYKIHRFRKMKAGAAGNDVFFYQNGVDKTRDNIAQTNAAIEQTIGLPYDIFVRIIVYSASQRPFLMLPGQEQIAVLEELFGTTDISKKADLLKKHIKETERQIELIQVKHKAEEGERARLATQIETAKKRIKDWDISRDQGLALLKQQLATAAQIDIDEQLDFHKLLDTTTQDYNDATRTYKTLTKNLTDTDDKHTKATRDLAHLVAAKCPYCHQSYTDTQDKIKECKIAIDKYKTIIDTIEDELKLCENSGLKLKKRMDKIKAAIIIQSVQELQELRDNSLTVHQKIIDLKDAINPYASQLSDLLDVTLPTSDHGGLNKLMTELHHQQFLLKLLTKKDSFIRKALLQKNLPYLNKKLQEYLKFLGLPHKVTFTKEMQATIHQMGRALSFGNLSQGQAARVNFALSLAFRDVLQHLHPTINIFLLDEVLDFGLDAVGVIAAAKLVKQKARDDNICIYVISHRDEVSSIFDDQIIVQMHKGFSSIRTPTIIPVDTLHINRTFGDVDIVNSNRN